MKALIITGGYVNISFLQYQINNNQYDKLIAVDKGLDYLYELEILPDVIIGDFDSLNKNYLEEYRNRNICIIEYSSDKNNTDTDLAISYAIENKINMVDIVGALGNRMDHGLANIMLMERYVDSININVIDEFNYIRVVKGEVSLKISKDRFFYLSLLPLTDEVEGVITRGLKYELENKVLERASSLGVSNEIVDKSCEIKIRKGTLLIIQSSNC